ncbi:DUF6221 family protein [Nocardiopsis sp. NRRL B-16309]|uniref:DUF6221 family protein n=1 Tax=Nocardiopsis sp. NRRL B-16309 TaxID=1519494 RepID=UPI0006AE8D27|nr:DUF6221 family protein [Nocardiopsis sp. NRRL B-16309]KOX10111.1 hypothetical protein ADL05_25855 [Nocardiopsis sp. NRRL B-16309]
MDPLAQLVQLLREYLEEDEANAPKAHLSHCGTVIYNEEYGPDACDCGYPQQIRDDIAAKRALLDEWENTKAVVAEQEFADGPQAIITAMSQAVAVVAQAYKNRPDFPTRWTDG